MKLLRNIGIKVISIVMIFTLMSGIVLSSNTNTVYANSGDRISAFINMAAGKNTTNLDLNELNLTEADLRFLGVYVSNFFVPFGTELGVSGTTNDVTSMNKEDIVTALQTNLNFSDSLAESLTETLLGLSRQSVEKLELCVSTEYQSDMIIPVSDDVSTIPLNSYTAMFCLLGGLQELLSWYEEPNAVMEGILDGTYKYGYFAYKSGTDYIPVFDFSIDMSELTASNVAFIKCLESVDIENGYGFNFFDLTSEETGVSEGDFSDIVTNFSDAQVYSMSSYGTELMVDCFGNIIFKGGNHQFIAVPGCMNPYTWVEVDGEGNDVGKGIGGTVYNMINIPSMSMYGSTTNALFTSTPTGSGKTLNASVNTSVLVDKLQSVAWNPLGPGGVLTVDETDGAYALRLIRGSSENKLGTIASLIGIDNAFHELTTKAESGFVEANPKAESYWGSWKDGFLYGKDGIQSSWWQYTDAVTVSGVILEKSDEQLSDSNASTNQNVKVFDSFVYIDDLGAYHFDESNEVSEFNTFNIERYTTESTTSQAFKDSVNAWGSSSDNGFTNTYQSVKNGDMIVPTTISKEGMVGLYVTYVCSSLYNENSEESINTTIALLGYRMNNNTLPTIPESGLVISSSVTKEEMDESIKGWIYYILHPTEGLGYFKTWMTNKLNSFLLGWHEDMVGTSGTGSVNGTTKYRGFSGYVTTPELTDIPWTNSLLNMYNNAIPFFLVIIALIMLGAYVIGILTIQKAVIGFMIFAIAIPIPPIAINGVVGASNRLSSSLYGEKFTYWALVQHETYSSAIDEAANADGGSSYSNYLKTLYETNSLKTGNQGNESIMIKWQAPKKMASLMLTDEDESLLDNASGLVPGLLNSTYSGESYLDDDSVYLYRSYIDIANFSRYIHRGLEGGLKQPISQNITNSTMDNWTTSLQDAIRDFPSKYELDRNMGYANINGDGTTSGVSNDIIRIRLPLSSELVNEQLANIGTISDMGIDDYVGINQDAFEFSIPMFNVGDGGNNGLSFKDELKTDNFDTSRYSNSDFSALASYGLMSENVFYYFSWYLYEVGMEEETYLRTSYKDLLLGGNNAEFFYNTKGNGELKDFMDMKSLFTYVIPYLKLCNELVYEWDDVYGIYIHEGVPTEEGHQNDPDIINNPELKQKYWHNLNVARLYNMYTPWVDVMYDCSYAKPEKISYLGEDYVVEDPINPASYPDDRPMVFSRSEMADYGLKENDLTKVEKLIIECEEGMQERMFNLLNYHTFNDVVLNTAAAMNCAFEFNETFSENSIIGANHNIYPQTFELTDFSYDAYLRFILSNSTGESMVVGEGEDFYSNITTSSSMTTVIVMLILDILSIYVIPGLKIFFIIGIFLLSILVILVSAFRVDQQQKFITRFINSFVKPVVLFFIVTCAMSLIVSWFMGNGNTSITGEMGTSIALGDPVMAMLAMIVLNCFVVFAYVKILIGVLKDVKVNTKLVTGFVGGVAGGIAGGIVGGVGSLARGAGAVGRAGYNGIRNASGRSDSEKDGKGSSNPRAKSRGSSNNISDKEKKATETIKRDLNKTSPKPKNNNKDKSNEKSNVINKKASSGLKKIKVASKKVINKKK